METVDGGRLLHLSTGITTAVTEQGDPSREPLLLLLHAWAGSRRSFARLLPLLPSSLHTAAIDLRGHGDADKPPTGYDLATLARDVVASLDALEVRRAVLVGASSGGYVAQQVAVTEPDRVAGLVLAGSPRDLRGRPPFADALEQMPDPADPIWVRTFTASFTDLARLPPWYVDLMVEDGLRLPTAIWWAAFLGLHESRPPTDLGTISAPTVVISGAQDGLLGRGQAAELVAAVPGARLLEYAHTGHLVLEEQPARLAADTVSFVRALPQRDEN